MRNSNYERRNYFGKITGNLSLTQENIRYTKHASHQHIVMLQHTLDVFSRPLTDVQQAEYPEEILLNQNLIPLQSICQTYREKFSLGENTKPYTVR